MYPEISCRNWRSGDVDFDSELLEYPENTNTNILEYE